MRVSSLGFSAPILDIRALAFKVNFGLAFSHGLQYLHGVKREAYSFFDDVWDVVRLIPHGRCTSYGAIAEFLGTKMSARMVGWAMNACPADVPAHRVLNRNGLLTGKHHFPEEHMMQELLEKEGVVVQDDKVRDWDKVFWHPKALEA